MFCSFSSLFTGLHRRGGAERRFNRSARALTTSDHTHVLEAPSLQPHSIQDSPHLSLPLIGNFASQLTQSIQGRRALRDVHIYIYIHLNNGVTVKVAFQTVFCFWFLPFGFHRLRSFLRQARWRSTMSSCAELRGRSATNAAKVRNGERKSQGAEKECNRGFCSTVLLKVVIHESGAQTVL